MMFNSATEYVAALGVGLDCDWLKTSYGIETYFNARAKNVFFPKVLKDRGFSTARIRIKDYDLPLDKLVSVVDDCLASELIPVIAFQGQNFKDSPNDTTRQEMINWWKPVAIILKDYPQEVAFNLLIETTDAVRNNPAALNQFYAECAPELQAINPNRFLIIPPCGISSPSQLINLTVPTGCFAEAHFNAAGFTKTPGPNAKLWTTGTDKEKAPILKNIADIKSWSTMTGIPVWIGAIMLGNFDDNGDAPSTSQYTPNEQTDIATFICGELCKAGISFGINADQHYMNRETGEWLSELNPVLNAITGVIL